MRSSSPSARAAGCTPFLRRLLCESTSRAREIERFYARLRAGRVRDLDALFREAHEHAFARVVCTDCAACCRSPGPRLGQADVRRLAERLGMRPSVFAERYLRVDEDGDTVLRSLPCPFLRSDNLCDVYDSRPKACRDYPHTDQKGMQALLRITAKNAVLCPAVYLVTEELRGRLGR